MRIQRPSFPSLTWTCDRVPFPLRTAISPLEIAPRSRSGNFFAFLTLLFCTLVCGIPTPAQSSALTVPRNLAQLVAESQIVIQGQVINVDLKPHENLKNLMTVVVTLQVEDSLKGYADKTYTFSQAVIDKIDLQRRMGYSVGQHLLLVLIKPSAYGLSSPAGMEQGRFRIERGAQGKLLATNGFSNAGLFRGVDSELRGKRLRISPEAQAMVAKPGTGPVDLDGLKNLIRAIAGANP